MASSDSGEDEEDEVVVQRPLIQGPSGQSALEVQRPMEEVEEAPIQAMQGRLGILMQDLFWAAQNWEPPRPHSLFRQRVPTMVLEEEREEDVVEERELLEAVERVEEEGRHRPSMQGPSGQSASVVQRLEEVEEVLPQAAVQAL